jgi:hypothetical protein
MDEINISNEPSATVTVRENGSCLHVFAGAPRKPNILAAIVYNWRAKNHFKVGIETKVPITLRMLDIIREEITRLQANDANNITERVVPR